jgi:hypothetical protein
MAVSHALSAARRRPPTAAGEKIRNPMRLQTQRGGRPAGPSQGLSCQGEPSAEAAGARSGGMMPAVSEGPLRAATAGSHEIARVAEAGRGRHDVRTSPPLLPALSGGLQPFNPPGC